MASPALVQRLPATQVWYSRNTSSRNDNSSINLRAGEVYRCCQAPSPIPSARPPHKFISPGSLRHQLLAKWSPRSPQPHQSTSTWQSRGRSTWSLARAAKSGAVSGPGDLHVSRQTSTAEMATPLPNNSVGGCDDGLEVLPGSARDGECPAAATGCSSADEMSRVFR